MKRAGFFFLSFLMVALSYAGMGNEPYNKPHFSAAELDVLQLTDFVLGTEAEQRLLLDQLEAQWSNAWVVPVLEVIRVTDREPVKLKLFDLLKRQTGQQLGYSINAWFAWIWEQSYEPLPAYAEFKAALYWLLDRKFEPYFSSDRKSVIRLDEVRWGGVVQDGIPPLRNPSMIPASEAAYLADTDVVFGVKVGDDIHAFPKRIMGWHELFTGSIGGVPMAGVYCTLCGSMIMYETVSEGHSFSLGTSGFLYRSNKLMYDAETSSLWNTIWGEPVIGPLVGQNIKLKTVPVVTTTWGAWKALHPTTKVLALETGFSRNYDEGEAYRSYFSNDELMFNTSVTDLSLRNKAEVLAIRFSDPAQLPFALSVDFLKAHKIYYNRVGSVHFVVLTDASGASRVYDTGGLRFKRWDGRVGLVDDQKRSWTLTEEALLCESGEKMLRIPAHRAFWFGWKAAYPNTLLVK